MNYYMLSITVICRLIKVLTGRKIDEISGEIGFNKRKTGIKAVTFFKAFTIGIWNAHDITLDIIAGKCEEFQDGFRIKKQSLLNRLKLGKELMKQALGMATNFVLKNSLRNETIEVLKQFRDVLICDSTTISLPDKLKDTYKGMGGRNAASALKIQAVYSIISHRFGKMELTSGTSSDRKYTDAIVEMLKPLELVIFDLGYFTTKAFRDIINKGGYFVSRIKTNTLFYVESMTMEGAFDKINLLELLKRSNDSVDTFIYIGENKLQVRLAAEKLPEKVINERRRKEIKKAKNKGKMLTDYELELLAWNILVTNVPQDMLSVETICELYRVRWQVELIFKSWKSYFDIDKMHNVGKDYLECIIYGKLIVISLMTTLFSVFNAISFRTTGRLLSFMKFFKNLREKLSEITENFNYKGAKGILQILNRVVKRSLEEKRKRKTTQRQLMEHDLPLLVLQMLA
jgi:hypothetical protein